MKWRLIEQKAYSPAMNMAIDNSIYESVADKKELPTIRFYKWIPSSISIGAQQNQKEINLDACKEHNIGTVRRMTGGRAVFHDKSDFTYSVTANMEIFDRSIENAYRQVCSWIIDSLKQLGISAILKNKNDVVVNGKKISGNAAKATENGVYIQHGTLIYDIDFDIMPKVLNISKLLAKERIASVLEYKKASQNEVYDSLKNNFTKNKEFKTEEISKHELMRAEDLAETKYNTIILPAGSLTKNKGVCYVERTAQ